MSQTKPTLTQMLLHVRLFHVEQMGLLNTAVARAQVAGELEKAQTMNAMCVKHVHCIQLLEEVINCGLEDLAKRTESPVPGAGDNGGGDFMVQSGIPEPELLGSSKN